MEAWKGQTVIMAIQSAANVNCAMSFPVPVKKGVHILDAAFLYPAGLFSPLRPRPFAAVLLEPNSGAMLEYRNAYIHDFADSALYPMGIKLDYSVPFAKTAAEQGKLTETVNELYAAVRELAWKDALTDAERNTAAEYRACFAQAVPKALLPFYRALSPDFFKWLEIV